MMNRGEKLIRGFLEGVLYDKVKYDIVLKYEYFDIWEVVFVFVV